MNDLPPLPDVDEREYLIIKRGTAIIIICVLMITFMVVLFLDRTQNDIKKLDIKCISSGVVLRNNIQASHAYTEQISEKAHPEETLICVKADDNGLLWGNSMQPTFFEGNTLLSKKYTPEVILHTGDLVRYFRYSELYPNCSIMQDAIANNSLGGSYINNSMAVIHRIAAIYDDEIVVVGDNLHTLETINKCQITHIGIGIIFT